MLFLKNTNKTQISELKQRYVQKQIKVAKI